MAFAQLTYRESLRDIEACLSAQTAKLYPMGFREPVHRSTLADANEARDWRIYAEFAQRLIAQARRLYAGDSGWHRLADMPAALPHLARQCLAAMLLTGRSLSSVQCSRVASIMARPLQ